MAIDYAKKYQKFIDEELAACSATEWMAAGAGQVRYGEGKEVEINTLKTTGLGNYDSTKTDGTACRCQDKTQPAGEGAAILFVLHVEYLQNAKNGTTRPVYYQSEKNASAFGKNICFSAKNEKGRENLHKTSGLGIFTKIKPPNTGERGGAGDRNFCVLHNIVF